MVQASHPPRDKNTASMDGCQYCGRCTVGEDCPWCGHQSLCDLCKVCWTEGCGYDASLHESEAELPTIGDLATAPIAEVLREEGARRRELGQRLLEEGA